MRFSLPFLLLVATASAAVAQTTHTVTLSWPPGSFSPNELTVDLGDTVHFNWASGFHSVDSFQGLFSSGAPVVAPNTFDVVFDQAFLNAAAAIGETGTSFDYFCTPHLAGGMVGNVTVALPGRPLLEVSAIEQGGTATVSVSNGTPNKLIGVAYSLVGHGPAMLPAGPCGPVSPLLSAPVTVSAILTADPSGAIAFQVNVPPNTQGVSVYLQSLDLDSCTLSNAGAWRIR